MQEADDIPQKLLLMLTTRFLKIHLLQPKLCNIACVIFLMTLYSELILCCLILLLCSQLSYSFLCYAIATSLCVFLLVDICYSFCRCPRPQSFSILLCLDKEQFRYLFCTYISFYLLSTFILHHPSDKME